MIMNLCGYQAASATSGNHSLCSVSILAAMWRFENLGRSLIGGALLLSALVAAGQGTFQNLNFESANIPPGTQPLADLSFGNALPGWSGTYGNGSGSSPATFVVYDGMSLGGPVMCIIDKLNVGTKPLQGNYSPYLFGGNDASGRPTSMTLSQTGLVPDGAAYILMDVYAWNGFSVSLGGQTIITATGPASGEYRAGISGFAGQTTQLSITVPSSPQGDINPNGLLLDDIRFVIVPEPSSFALFAVGALLIGCHAHRRFEQFPVRNQLSEAQHSGAGDAGLRLLIVPAPVPRRA